jgi:hypothetical protein
MLKGSPPHGMSSQYALLYRANASQGDNGRMSFSLSTLRSGWQDYLSDDNISLDVWNHVAGTYKPGDLRLYIDGKLARNVTTNIVGNLFLMKGDLFIGAEHSYPNAEFFKGMIDEIRIYDRALSEAEISALALQPGR